MQTKISAFLPKITRFIQRFSDVRFAGQVIFVIIVLLISWSGAKAIQSNYGLQKQVTAINQQNSIQQLENTNLALQNKYYNSNQYLELSARQNFGLASPGEKELLVPQSVALAYAPNPAISSAVASSTISSPHSQNNFEAWVSFFLHRQS